MKLLDCYYKQLIKLAMSLSYITSCLKQHSASRMNLLNDRLDVNLRRAHNLTDNSDVD